MLLKSTSRLLLIVFLISISAHALAQENSGRFKGVFSQIDSLVGDDVHSDAKLLLDSVKELIGQDKRDEIIQYHQLLGDYYLSQSLYLEAIKAYEPVLAVDSRDLGKDLTLILARAINDLGIAFVKTGRSQEAIDAHMRSLELYQLFDDAEGAGFNFNNIAIIYTQRKMVDSAIYFHNKSIEFAHIAKDTIGIGFNLLGIGVLYADNKDEVSSLDYFHQALDVFQSIDHKSMLNGTRRRMAIVYARMRDFESAIDIYKSVLEYYMQSDSRNGLAGTHISIAELLMEMDMIDSAKYHIDKSIEHYTPTNYAKGLAKSWNINGRYLREVGRLDEAVESFTKANSYSKEEPGMLLSNWIGISGILLQRGEYRRVIDGINQGLDGVNHSASPGNLASAYEILYVANKNLGNPVVAMEYLELYNQQRDLVFDEDRLMEVARIEYRNQLERERALEEEEKARVELQYQQDLARERWIRFAALFIAIFVGIIALLAYRAYKIKRSANVQLSDKNQKLKELRENEKRLSDEALASKERELATMAMATHEKNAVLKDLEQKVSFIEKRMDEEFRPSLKEMKKTIKDSYSLDKSWDSFIHRFEDVHPQFFDKLKGENPSLTVEDLKLSAYLKIGMSNKEIANVTHLTLGSVKSKINRLKKKLEVGPDDSVRDFMLKYA